MKWPEFNFPPINLWSLPFFEKKCKHERWMLLHSHKEKWCYGCGKREPITNNIPIEHQR